MLRPFIALLSLFLLLGCGETVTASSKDARILLMGDSMMAANRTSGRAVANAIEARLGEEVIDRSVVASRYFYYLPISGAAGLRLPAQFKAGNWDWVVINGGGNDLLFGCGCGMCNGMVDRLVNKDGTAGAIPELMSRIRQSGAKVVYAGYLRNPGLYTPVRACRPYGDELDRRLARMAARPRVRSCVCRARRQRCVRCCWRVSRRRRRRRARPPSVAPSARPAGPLA